MLSSSESDFESKHFEKDESKEFSSENELSESLQGRFSCPISWNQRKKKLMKKLMNK